MNAGTILIADDNATNRALLSASLAKAGYRTVEAVDGNGALAQALSERPDLVLLDVEMPGRDGFEVCRILKTDPTTRETPVVFLTAHSRPEDIERAFAVGGSDYVTKPFHMGEVKARISVHLQLREARETLETTHAKLLHAQKLESIGQLAAGIAHEINTPTQFVGDNTRFLQESFDELLPLLDDVRAVAAAAGRGELDAARAERLRAGLEDADLDYLREEIPRAIRQSLEGIGRVASIVGAMREFSHPGATEKTQVDLNKVVASTVTVSTNEWKYVAEVQLELDPELPPVHCHPGEIGQVVLNLIVNAAQAIAPVVDRAAGEKGTITVATRRAGDEVELRVADTGCGIPPEVRGRIFDPFFTTKGVGEGTGQGLAIAHNVVVVDHEGAIELESAPGRGTTFVVRLPLGRAARRVA